MLDTYSFYHRCHYLSDWEYCKRLQSILKCESHNSFGQPRHTHSMSKLHIYVHWDWTTNSSISNSKKNGCLEKALPSCYSLTFAVGNVDFIVATQYRLFSPLNVIKRDSSKMDQTKGWINATYRLWPIGDILRVWERTSENEAEVFMTQRFIIAILFPLLSLCVSLFCSCKIYWSHENVTFIHRPIRCCCGLVTTKIDSFLR